MAIWQIAVKQSLHAQEIRNIFYYDDAAITPSGAEWQNVADEIRGYWATNWVPKAVTAWSTYGIDVREVDTAGLPSVEYTYTAGPLAGAVAADSVATQVALLVRVQGLTAKPRRARTYLAGGNELDLVTSLWSSVIRAPAESLINDMALLNQANPAPLNRVAAQWNVGHTQVINSNDISGRPGVSSVVPATQRRRRIGVGI